MTSYRYMGGVWRVAACGPCSMGTLPPIPPTTLHQGTRKEGQDSRGPAPFLVCVGNGEPGGGHRAGLAPPPSLSGAPVPSVHGPGGG